MDEAIPRIFPIINLRPVRTNEIKNLIKSHKQKNHMVTININKVTKKLHRY